MLQIYRIVAKHLNITLTVIQAVAPFGKMFDANHGSSGNGGTRITGDSSGNSHLFCQQTIKTTQ